MDSIRYSIFSKSFILMVLEHMKLVISIGKILTDVYLFGIHN